jgi:uncharacterized membrane protein YfcA
MINWKSRLLMFLLAILGSVCGYILINQFIINITISQYIGIEVIVTIFHGMYNYSKKTVIQSMNDSSY